MGRLYNFPSRDQSELIGWDEFQKAVGSSETAARIGKTVPRLLGISTVQIELPRLVRIDEDIDKGTLHHVPGTTALASHEKFPQFLKEQGLGSGQALRLAAGATVAYHNLALWMARMGQTQRNAVLREANRGNLLPAFPSTWQEQDYSLNMERQLPAVIVNRMAARVALDAAEIRVFEVDDPTVREPIHIAALLDPFDASAMRNLGSIAGTTH